MACDLLKAIGIQADVLGKSWDETKLLKHANVIVFGYSHDPTEMYSRYHSSMAGIPNETKVFFCFSRILLDKTPHHSYSFNRINSLVDDILPAARSSRSEAKGKKPSLVRRFANRLRRKNSSGVDASRRAISLEPSPFFLFQRVCSSPTITDFMDKRVGFVGIIIENREQDAEKVNHILSQHADMIIARTGIPYKEKHCAVITLTVDATTDEIGQLTGQLGQLPSVSVKSALSKKK